MIGWVERENKGEKVRDDSIVSRQRAAKMIWQVKMTGREIRNSLLDLMKLKEMARLATRKDAWDRANKDGGGGGGGGRGGEPPKPDL